VRVVSDEDGEHGQPSRETGNTTHESRRPTLAAVRPRGHEPSNTGRNLESERKIAAAQPRGQTTRLIVSVALAHRPANSKESTGLGRECPMRKSLSALIVGLSLPFLVGGIAMADDDGDDHRCDLRLLDGLYVFSASGFAIPSGAPSFPKAIIEVLRFHGDGTVETPASLLNMNGTPITSVPAGAGKYTVSEVSPPDTVCVGTLTFTDPPHPSFNLVIGPGGKKIWLIMTSPPSVFEGNAIRVSR